MSKSELVLASMLTLMVLVNIRSGKNFPLRRINKSYFPNFLKSTIFRGFQMVRTARLGLAMAPTLSLKVLTNFRLSMVTSYERISTNFNKKVKRLMEEKAAK